MIAVADPGFLAQVGTPDLVAASAVVSGVTAVIGLGIYVWYAFALSKLFPKLDQESWKGWVPVVNEATILQIGGRPAWNVVFYFIPIVQLYGLYLKVLATHDINKRFGRGAGFTVLAILLPPVWATLLAWGAPPYPEGDRLASLHGPRRVGTDAARAAGAPGAQGYLAPPIPHGGPAPATGSFAPSFAPGQPSAPGAFAPEQPSAPGAFAPQGFVPQPPPPATDSPAAFDPRYSDAPDVTIPAVKRNGAVDPVTGLPAPAFGQAAPAQPAPLPISQGLIDSVPGVAPHEPPLADQAASEQPAAAPAPESPQPFVPAQPVSPAQPSDSAPPAAPPAPVQPAPVQPAFPAPSVTDRLSDPAQPVAPAPPAWPAASAAPASPVEPVAPVQQEVPARPLAPVEPAPPQSFEQSAPPAAPPAPAQVPDPATGAALAPEPPAALSPSPAAEAPAPPAAEAAAPPAAVVDQTASEPSGDAASAPAAPETPAAAPFAEPPRLRGAGLGTRADRAASIRPVPVVLPVPEQAQAPAPAPAADPADDDVEATVVVQRNRGPRRVLVLDDGRTFALSATSIVIGRNPEGAPGEQRLSIPDKTRTLSKTHARLVVQGDEWRLTDLHSTNGVVVVADDGAETLLDAGESVTGAGRFVLGEVGMHVALESGS